MKQKKSLELLKFFAALLITNSHLGYLYGQYSFLATGGAIGNALFFFCSGYALSMSKFDRFDNWYKRRFFRVMPSMLAKGILCSLLGLNLTYVAIYQIFIGGGWYFNAVMIFYLLIYILQLFTKNNQKLDIIIFISIFAISCLVAVFLIDNQGMLYTGSSYKQAWPGYFSTMFLGYILGKKEKTVESKYDKVLLLVLVLSIVLYYGILFVVQRYELPVCLGIISLIPLYFILITWYYASDCKCLDGFYSSKYWFPFKFVSSLCWEIYLAQIWIVLKYKEQINQIIFPLNIVVCVLLIIICAYVIKVMSRFIVQLFNNNSFNWIYTLKTWER